LSEEIVCFKRRWFVLLDDAPAVFPRLFAHRKPVKDLTASKAVIEPNSRS
jgi:hypothetical protein